ncbi:hypothetical protein [Candidatus Sororendozoicomonas aggregata]|uniref:hypothetical protein n=1 Tax=Candidatus Sororendozoicomonas aggregata TaxID=3073239 RepID=UPI002ED5724B
MNFFVKTAMEKQQPVVHIIGVGLLAGTVGTVGTGRKCKGRRQRVIYLITTPVSSH